MRLTPLAGVLFLALIAASRGAAQATPYVPMLDPAYADLDALVSAGWVRGAILGERPYSRLTMARFTLEGRGRVAGDSVGAPRARMSEALGRLQAQFAPEIASLCALAPGPAEGPPPACPEVPRGIATRSLTADATLADSPSRRIPSSYDFVNSDYIDADQNPLLQRNEGRILADGGTMAAEGAFDAVATRHLAAHAQPRAWALDDTAGGGDADLTLVDGYARAVFGNFAVDAGRLHVALGHGREAGPVLSHNARGLDLVRISTDRPARLPGVFRALGRLTASALMADMGTDVDTPHSKLLIGDLVLQPHPVLELSATVLNQQGGEGSPPATLTERLLDLFLISPQHAPISDKVMGGGIALILPPLRSRLYANAMTTDDHDLFRAEFDQAVGPEAVWIWGVRTMGLGSSGRLDLWGELRRSGVRPQTHHQFTSGETQDRRVIGDALGPLAHSLAAGGEWRGSVHRASVQLDLERYNNADLYQIIGSGRFEWTRTRDQPDEERARLTGEWSIDPRSARIGALVRIGVERVGAFDFTTSRGRWNALAQGRLEYRPH